MPAPVLNVAAQIMCPHGGQAVLTTTNTHLMAGGAPALTMADVHMIAGCPFVIVLKPSPCLRIQWVTGSTRLKVNGVPVLTLASVGLCLSPEQAPQGPAIISSPGQTRLMAD
jgi:hypothetical protein